MSENIVVVREFPKYRREVLALEYVKAQNLRGVDPESLVRLYWETYFLIEKADDQIEREVFSTICK